jgi:DNA-directed RNA polymerase specialized sigma24 family protein
MLKAVHGMRSRQIAEILDIPEATVDTRISRARRMLRESAALYETQRSRTHAVNSAVLNGQGRQP